MEREARRKRIKSREMDRMALITGRIQSLDPDIPKSSSFSDNRGDDLPAFPKHSRSASEPAPPQNDAELFLHRRRDEDDEDVPDPVSRHENDDDFSKERGAATAPSSPPPSLRRTSSALIATPTSRKAKIPKDEPIILEYHLSSISPRDINLSIMSSEHTRAFCSCAIALLVVLSHINLPHKLIKSKSLLAYRPLYAVLLSDLLIAATTLALLIFHGKESEKVVKLEKDVNWDGAVKLLEWGLILHQTVRAIFIDCSLYLAIVVCGLSLMH